MSKILIDKATVKLALEALKVSVPVILGNFSKHSKAIAALEALAEPDFWEGYVPEPDNTCNNALREQGKAYPRTCKKCGLGPCVELAQQALNKKAENAREQPAQKCSYPYCGCNSKAWCKVERNEALDKMAENAKEIGLTYEPAQQEPVAWRNAALRVGEDLCSVGPFGYYDMTAEQWLDWALSVVTVHAPPAQRKWQGLTDEERKLVRNSVGYNQFVTAGEYAEHVQKATEFKLMEKNA